MLQNDSNDMKLVVWKKSFRGQILYRSPDPVKKRRQSYKKRFEDLPKIKSYITSDKFMTGPCNNKMAKWGGDKELKRTW